ncbi:hypothetical protein AK812_SmicGene1123 [Symbiodinium microadriaticum]|uniref:Reverse transcriptase domain-containing protein n=1 Tax=Symbiodinium microadriaticum TaxID=2951 RepID=A0A1Q9F507_SYMMI|nr:hypothetical protein AK812_SmicGene1123 [Symbiodinium microadriaticum]
MDDLLQQLQHKINRTHPICVPSVNDKETGSRLCHWSPLADALGSNDPKSGGEWWAILDKLAAEDPGCGAAVGCLVGLALGDACGAPLEFCAVDSRLPDLPAGDFSDLRRPCLSGQLDDTGQLVYQNARNKFDLKLGQWTDDASMALCLADSLLVRGRYDGGDVRVRWHMWWFHGYCNAFRYDAERRKGRGSVGLGGNVAKSLQEIERSVQIAQSSGRLQKNASHASVVPPIYQSSSNDSGNGAGGRTPGALPEDAPLRSGLLGRMQGTSTRADSKKSTKRAAGSAQAFEAGAVGGSYSNIWSAGIPGSVDTEDVSSNLADLPGKCEWSQSSFKTARQSLLSLQLRQAEDALAKEPNGESEKNCSRTSNTEILQQLQQLHSLQMSREASFNTLDRPDVQDGFKQMLDRFWIDLKLRAHGGSLKLSPRTVMGHQGEQGSGILADLGIIPRPTEFHTSVVALVVQLFSLPGAETKKKKYAEHPCVPPEVGFRRSWPDLSESVPHSATVSGETSGRTPDVGVLEFDGASQVSVPVVQGWLPLPSKTDTFKDHHLDRATTTPYAAAQQLYFEQRRTAKRGPPTPGFSSTGLTTPLGSEPTAPAPEEASGSQATPPTQGFVQAFQVQDDVALQLTAAQAGVNPQDTGALRTWLGGTVTTRATVLETIRHYHKAVIRPELYNLVTQVEQALIRVDDRVLRQQADLDWMCSENRTTQKQASGLQVLLSGFPADFTPQERFYMINWLLEQITVAQHFLTARGYPAEGELRFLNCLQSDPSTPPAGEETGWWIPGLADLSDLWASNIVCPEVWKNTLEALDESLGVLTDQEFAEGDSPFSQEALDQELKHFYEVKYSSFLPPPTPEAIQGMIRTHASVQPDPFTQEELASAIGRCKSNTSAGMDGVGYEAIKAYFRRVDIPASWREAKVVLLPKAAFDSLSHAAVVNFLASCKACPEASLLWDLCSSNQLHMSLGTAEWKVRVSQGILQGSAYSADLFARTLDYHLRGLQDKWTQDYPAWGDNLSLPHFLLYADDIMLFAMSPREMQRKLHELADTLATIGLFVNPKKCSVLNINHTTPGIWPRGACRPLEGKDRLMFLGVPLAHTNSPDLVLAHPLRKLTNSFFAMKKILDKPATPRRTKEDLLGKVMLSPKKLPERRGGGGQGGTEMPAKRPRLDAEVLALAKLQQDDFVTKEDALAVLRLIPNGEWSPHHGGRSISFGAFQRATSALRATTRRYHIATRLLTKLVRQWSPDTSFTSMTILDNAKCPPHMDCRNSEVPGMLMTLTQGYTGGELWLAHERGGERMLHAGIWRQGIKIDVTTPFCFSARSILHATCAWSGDRIALAAYSTPRSTVNLDETKTFRLVSLGFRPPTPELEDRFRYEQWGATVTKQLRMQPRLVWPAGVLLQTGPIRLDLEDDSLPPTVAVDSESESDVVSLCMGAASPEPDFWECTLSDPESCEAWIRIHNSQQQMIELMQELRSDMAVMRRRTNDTMDTLFHGLEARKHLGMVSNTHDMVMELHGRRANLAEVQHVSYLRARLEDLTQQVMQLRDQQGATSVQGGQLPIVRLAVPDGSELQLL